MKSKPFIILGILFAAGAVLFGLGLLFTPASSAASGRQALSPFHSVRLSVKAADVTIVTGSEFAISYDLHSREPLTELEVRDGVLHFDTGYSRRWARGGGDRSVVITVPEGTIFDALELKTVSGDIQLSGHTVSTAVLESTSGDIELDGIVCGQLTAKTVSDDIELKNSTIGVSAQLNTVSGDITAEAPFKAASAKSVGGGVELNGAEQGRRMSVGQGQPSLNAESVSGEVSVYTH